MIHLVTPLRRPTDCTRKGVTARFDSLLLADTLIDAAKYLQDYPADSERMLVMIDGHAAPYTEVVLGKRTMMGGNYVHSSNGSFTDLYAHPIPARDRIETAEPVSQGTVITTNIYHPKSDELMHRREIRMQRADRAAERISKRNGEPLF